MTHAAITFLRTLDPWPDAKFNIETFTDLPKGAAKPKPDPLGSRYAELSIHEVEALIPRLAALNDSGAAVYFAVNECTGQRKKDNISRVRCIHADLDGAHSQERDRLRARLEPSIEVQTSGPDNQHWYWVLEDGEELSVTDAEDLNRQMVTHGADPAAVDASRLLRLPGFKHMKYRGDGRTPVVKAIHLGPRYTFEALATAFQSPPLTPSRPPSGALTPAPTAGEPWANIAAAVSSRYPLLWAGDWSNRLVRWPNAPYESQSQADLALAGHVARECARSGVPKAHWREAVEAVFGRSRLAERTKWQDRADYRDTTIERAMEGVVEPKLDLLDPNGHGDIRNAKAFALRAVDRLLYVTTRDRWLIWK